jgi:hypothetical protein
MITSLGSVSPELSGYKLLNLCAQACDASLASFDGPDLFCRLDFQAVERKGTELAYRAEIGK